MNAEAFSSKFIFTHVNIGFNMSDSRGSCANTQWNSCDCWHYAGDDDIWVVEVRYQKNTAEAVHSMSGKEKSGC